MSTRLHELLQKYDVPGPRYTSYPTVPAWTPDVGTQEYIRSLLAVSKNDVLSLYFHIPFCEKLCHFCGCFKIITKDHSRSLPYVDVLLKEMDLILNHLQHSKKLVSQIHFGGGTPNFLQPDEISQIMNKIRENFIVLPDAEIAIEMHPRTSTKEFCERLKQEGFNRISLGVQDFDPKVQKLINRHQTYEMTCEMLEILKGLGFKNFNFDLIYGLPGQNIETFSDTLKKTIALNPDRLAVYSYAHVPWKSPVQRSFKDEDLPTPEQKLQLFETAYIQLIANDYEQIGMDHFAKKSDELFGAMETGGIHRNFMGYSTHAEAHQIGFGISSISYVSGNYFQNSKMMDDYEKSIRDGVLKVERGYILSADDKIRRDVITELMCLMRVDKVAFSKKHKINFDEYFSKSQNALQSFVQDGLLKITNDEIRVLGDGKLALRNMAMCFDAYLDAIRENSKNPVFSRTV